MPPPPPAVPLRFSSNRVDGFVPSSSPLPNFAEFDNSNSSTKPETIRPVEKLLSNKICNDDSTNCTPPESRGAATPPPPPQSPPVPTVEPTQQVLQLRRMVQDLTAENTILQQRVHVLVEGDTMDDPRIPGLKFTRGGGKEVMEMEVLMLRIKRLEAALKLEAMEREELEARLQAQERVIARLKGTRLTSRNLFDEVFATIPPDVVLYTGPVSLREKIALMEARQAAAQEEANEKRSEAPPATSAELGVVDLSYAMHRVEGSTAADETFSSHPVIDVQLDENDEAVQEATKYAAALDDVFANSLVEEHDTQSGDEYKQGTLATSATAQEPHTAVADGPTRPVKHILTAQEQIAILRPEDDGRHEGRCVLFRNNKGFGFITPNVGGPDVYFTRDSVEFAFTRRVLAAYSNPGEGGSILGASSTPAQVPANEADRNTNATETPHDTETTERTDNDREDIVRSAAALLTPATARLLELFLQVGKPIITVPEAVTFAVQWNRAGGRASSRRLRADAVRGLPANAYALAVEQVWFERAFGRGQKNETGTDNSEAVGCLSRHRGTVRSYDPDELRGYIRPDENSGNGQDVAFSTDVILWDPSMDPSHCRPSEGLVVRYCTTGCDRNGRSIATLITATDDSPLSTANSVWASGRGSDGASGGGRGGRDSETSGRKHQREEEMLLLEADGDYGFV